MPIHPLEPQYLPSLRSASPSVPLLGRDAPRRVDHAGPGRRPARCEADRSHQPAARHLHAELLPGADPGLSYELSRYLRVLQPHKEHFTVSLRHVASPMAPGRHAESALLTGVHPGDLVVPNDLKNSISLDRGNRLAASGSQTRFACLNLGGGDQVWYRRGVRMPSDQRAVQVFRRLFLHGSPEEEAREMRGIRDGRSILDDVHRPESSR